MRKVRIKGLPKAAHGGPTGGASEGLRRFLDGNKNYDKGLNQFAEPEFEVNKSIKAVDPEQANIEAEGGEFAVVPGEAGIPESYKIQGPRHNAGGVPLNLAEDSFIFSDTRDMKIKDKDILAEFGVSVPKKGRVKGKTPADIAKKFELNDYKKILMDPNSDRLERETAELMIENYNMKLGKLALVQESQKGFPQATPAIAMPYLQSISQDPMQFEGQEEQPPMAAYGAGVVGDPSQYAYGKYGGENKAMAKRFPGLDIKQRGGEFTGAFWDSILQDGGAISSDMMYAQAGGDVVDEYQTAQDFAANQEDIAGLKNAPIPVPLTEGEITMMYGSREEKQAWLFNAKKDAEALNLDPAEYVGQQLYEMTPEQLDRAEEDLTGWPWKSIKKEAAKDAAAANRNNFPLKLVDPNTGEVVDDNPSEKDIQAYKAVNNKTVKSNVETTGKRVWDIPDNAIIHEENDKYDPKTTKAGEYIRRKDGTLEKITKGKATFKGSTSGIENYVPKFGSIEQDVEEAKAIMKAYPDTFKKSGDKWNIASNNKDLPLEHQVFLTRLFSTASEKGKLGAPGLTIGTQSSKEGKGGFYGFVGPELIEYQNYKSNNPGATPEEFEVLSPAERLDNRKNYLALMDYSPEEIANWEQEGKLQDPDKLYTRDFLKGTKDTKGLTRRNQELLNIEGAEAFRPGHQDDLMFGLEHADAYNIAVPTEYEGVAMKDIPKERDIPAGDTPSYVAPDIDAPWWAQDVGNMMMTVNERAGLKKHLPKDFNVDLAMPDVVYYDPSRALAASAEQANIAGQTIRSFANSQQAAAKMSGIQGQAFAQAANTLADYEAKNVGVANQYLDKVKGTLDQESIANTNAMKQYFDEYTTAQQQFDNSKTALNRNAFEAWRQGLTNATKTQTLNMLYPQYNVGPSSGGKTFFTEGRDQVAQTPPGGSSSNINAGYQQFIKDTGLKKDDPNAYREYRSSLGLPTGRNRRDPRSAYWDAYNQKG